MMIGFKKETNQIDKRIIDNIRGLAIDMIDNANSGHPGIVLGAAPIMYSVFNNELNLPAYLTSTGQQKTVLIDLILAHAELVYTKTGNHALVLLDEAAAHLDSVARQNMFLSLGKSQAQVWATGLDPDVFTDVPNATFVACLDGGINNILRVEKKRCQE